MANDQSQSAASNQSSGDGKVGSDPQAAAKFGGKNDFGVPETGHERDREYVSHNTKRSDPGAQLPRGGALGDRTEGVGGFAAGPGSSSGGDLDPDIVGVGTGGSGISQAGPDDRTEGADMITGAPPVTRDRAHLSASGDVKRPIVHGDVVDHSGGDVSTTGDGAGAGAVTNPHVSQDDASAGEIDLAEAGGIDNSDSDRG